MIIAKRKSLVSLACSTAILAVGVISIICLLAIPRAHAQPAVYSTETGILDIPGLQLDDRAAFRNVELQQVDGNPGVFTLVDYRKAGEEGLQELALDHGQTMAIDATRTIQFLSVLAESRCPSDVVCITGGEVTVILRILETVAGGNVLRTDFGLTLGGVNISVHYDNGTYYRLVEATPYPVSTVTADESEYRIRVEYSPLPFRD